MVRRHAAYSRGTGGGPPTPPAPGTRTRTRTRPHCLPPPTTPLSASSSPVLRIRTYFVTQNF